MLIILIVIVVVVCTIAYYDLQYKKRVSAALLSIQGPTTTWPLLGDLNLFFDANTTKIFDVFEYFNEKYGRICRVWVFNKLFIIMQNAKYAEKVLSSPHNIRKNLNYDMLRTWLGDGLLVSHSSKWHVRRKIITPTFHFKILEQFIEVFDHNASILMKRLEGKANGNTVINIYPEVCLAALDIIAETAMGVKINAQEQLHNIPYVNALAVTARLLGYRSTKPAFYYNFIYNVRHFLDKLIEIKNIKIMHNFTDQIIRDRRKLLQTKQPPTLDLENHECGLKRRLAFLDLLLQSNINGQPLTNAEIREEVDTFMFEGHDTTTSAIAHILYLLSRHSEEQQKAYMEIQQVLGNDKNKCPTMHELQELKYVECVIKESLRLYPSVPMIGRYIDEEIKIDGETIIPVGTNIIMSIFAICRDPQYFTKPNDFIPERFYSGYSEEHHPFAFIPFSAGPRNCVGQKFAMLEMKVFVCKFLQYYELLEMGPDVVPELNLILRSATGVHLGLKPRS